MTQAISTPSRRAKRLSTLWLWLLCVCIATIGITSLLGWILAIPALNTWQADTRPTSSMTGALSVLFSVVLGLLLRQPSASALQLLTRLLGSIGIITAVLVWLLRLNHIYPIEELLGLPITGTFNTAPIGYISPITAFCFFLAFSTLFILPDQKTDATWRNWLPWGLSSLILFIGLGVLLTYIYGLPLIAGALFIPPALNSCCILVLTGLALLSLAYKNHLYQTDSQADIPFIKLPVYIYIFVLFSAGIFIIAFNYYRNIEANIQQQTEAELLAIMKLKSAQLLVWRKERLGNAIIYQNSIASTTMKHLLDHVDDLSSVLAIQDSLRQALGYFKQLGYTHAYLLDTKGHAILSVPEKNDALDTIVTEAALSAMHTGQISLQDFYKTQDGEHIYLGLIIPLLDKAANNKPLGAIVIRIDPALFLYPLIEFWPTSKASAETLLVRKEGNDVIYLNNLRFNPTAALKLRFPLSTKGLSAAKAVLGIQGITEGINYRGISVLSALQAIPESPWFIIAEIDNAEIYAPLQQRLWQTLLIITLLEIAGSALTFLIWRKQRLGFIHTQYELAELKKTEAKLQLAASVFTHAREGIMITNTEGEIIQVNNAFSKISSYRAEEVLGKNPRMLSSGRQSEDFYRTMWHDLSTKDHWYGEIWNRRKNGEVYAVMENISVVFDNLGNAKCYVALMSDITKNKEHEFELEQSAHFDPLTNLPNRVLLADRLGQAIAQARRRTETLAVVFIDLDGFKAINDQYGHLAGDQLLIAVTHNLTQILREVDTLARLGGDEFVAILIGINDTETNASLFNRLLAAAALPFPYDHNQLQVSASMGVTFYPQAEDVDADLLIRQADQAMYQAKQTGKNRYHLFDVAQDKLTRSQNETLASIHLALAANEFELYYQPKVNLRLGKIIGVEALIRWRHPTKGILAPAEFLPLIENHALSIDIGEWVINTAMSQIESWHNIGLNLPVSVNISARQLQQDGFLESLRQLLKNHPMVKQGDLEMEILETSAMRDLAKASQLMADSRDMGILFSLDDFGTGYSSLIYLKRLPINQLKIDQSFVRDMLNNVDDLAIVEGILALAAAFSLDVIAEGMETLDHGEILLQIGCDLAQGYAIAHPMPAAAVENWVATWQPNPGWIDRPSFTRADLPLLFANAEYKVWLNGVENYLEDKGPKPENLNSRFGTWLMIHSPVKKGHYESILTLHQELYAWAAKLIKQHENGRADKAQQGLAELYKRHDALQENLKELVEENWK